MHSPYRSTNFYGWLGALALSATVLLAGCSSTDTESAYDTDRTVLTATMQDLDIYYIRPLDFSDLTAAGLGELKRIDPDLSTAYVDNKILIKQGSGRAQEISAPDDNDPEEWGETAALALDAARQESPKIRAADIDTVHQAFFAGVLPELDMFSRYSTPKQARQNRAFREGFGGVGIRIMQADGKVKVMSVTHYTPAERAGIRVDDVIAAIDGMSVAGLDQTEVIDRIRGEVNTDVTLTIERPGQNPFDVTLTRSLIVPESVAYRRDGDLAYIRIFSFNTETTKSLEKAISQAQNEIGDSLKGYILDLRGNPGGLLDQAVSVSDLFLESGEVVATRGRHRQSNQHFVAAEGDDSAGLPIVILIDGNSASASEIVAAALQDSGRAVIVGSNSYGKGTVQTVIPLPNRGELIVTWARFFAPSGYMLHHLGVLPDICTSGDEADAGRILTALRRNTGVRSFPVSDRKGITDENSPVLKQLRATCPVLQEERALELDLATQLLRDPRLYRRILANSRENGGVVLATPPAF